MPNASDNPFVPYLATLKDVVDITPDVKLFKAELADPEARESFRYRPGQFAFVSAFGVGESAVTFVAAPQRSEGTLEFAIRRVGTVSSALHELEPGATIGVRGPYGNHFPLDDYRGKNILIIGGGIGMAPLRPIIQTIIDNRNDYGDLIIINGARSPQDLVFQDDFESWASAPDTRLELTVDRGDAHWTGRVALVPAVVSEVQPSPENCIAIICGPPIMIHFTLQGLKELGFSEEQVVTTLESKMKCGIGKCARCNVGGKYVCLDGPVFTFAQIAELPEKF